MLMVSSDPARVERELAAGVLRCPGCAERLAPWGQARWRNVRLVDGEQRLRPRRARCVSCGWTHVLLPDLMLVRRRDSVAVIGAAFVAHAAGENDRQIAARIGRHPSTVRGWLRRFRSRAVSIAGFFTQWALALSPGLNPPAPAGTSWGDAVEAVGLATRAAVLRFGPLAGWELAARLTGGGLLANTSCLWIAPG